MLIPLAWVAYIALFFLFLRALINIIYGAQKKLSTYQYRDFDVGWGIFLLLLFLAELLL